MDGTPAEGERANAERVQVAPGSEPEDRRRSGQPTDRNPTDRNPTDRKARFEAGAPLSWPLVERRRMPQLSSGPTDRRLTPGTPGPMLATLAATPLTPFRVAAVVGAIVVGLDRYSWSSWSLLICTAVVTIYTGFAGLYPIPYVNDEHVRMRTLAELTIVTGAVLGSGAWASPFALCLVPSTMLASLVGGAAFSLEALAGSATLITLFHLRRVGTMAGLAEAAPWVGVLILVAITTGLSHRRAQESASQQQAALDRVGSLAEANGLLFQLQRVAQTLPASLDLNDVLDSTVAQVQSLIDHSMLTILIQSDVPGRLEPVRVTGYAADGPISTNDLPLVLQEALGTPKTVRRDQIDAPHDSVAPSARSGLYAALRARGSVVGLIAVESLDIHHFGQQQGEILHGLAEPFGISIDNARLFKRLRIASADAERNRIARDLHDHIGSSLAFLGFELDRSIAVAGRGEPVEVALKELRLQVTAMVGEVRETLYDLRSDVSEGQDLAATLRQFVDRVRGRSGLEITFAAEQRVRLPISHERDLWHIAREALINVERHAQATQASMEWASTATHASLTIRDNGVGMLFGSGRVDSYGIQGMRERAAAIGAQMTTDSSPTGTVIRVELRQPEEERSNETESMMGGSPRWD